MSFGEFGSITHHDFPGIRRDYHRGGARDDTMRVNAITEGWLYAEGDVNTAHYHVATIAVAGEVPIHRLCDAVPFFPTISEVWLRLLEALTSARRSSVSKRFWPQDLR